MPRSNTQNGLPPSGDRPLSVHHVARILGISRRTVRHLAQNEILKGDKGPPTPKLWRFRRLDVETFKAQRDTAERNCSGQMK